MCMFALGYVYTTRVRVRDRGVHGGVTAWPWVTDKASKRECMRVTLYRYSIDRDSAFRTCQVYV